ncbi:MAG: hypothetical protein IH862_09450, partial [Chloroflexi bacterium]|nr:hypothetical protein [Chloroflexota bacterium]
MIAFLAIVVRDVRAEEPPPPPSGRYAISTSTTEVLEASQVRAVPKGVPKLESALQTLAGLYPQDAEPVPRFAGVNDFTFTDEGVVVVVRALAGRLADVLEQVSVLGGRVLRSDRDLAKVSIPIDVMESLANVDEVEFVRRPHKGFPA